MLTPGEVSEERRQNFEEKDRKKKTKNKKNCVYGVVGEVGNS